MTASRPLLLSALAAAGLLGAALLQLPGHAEARPEREPAATPGAFLERYCVRCHTAEDPSGLVVLEDVAQVDSATWRVALRLARKGIMPPKDEPVPRPSAAEVAALGSWVATHVEGAGAPRPALRRLNRAEYERTIRDLLGVHSRPARSFPDDDVANGFDTASAALSLPPPLLERYLEAAERVAAEAVLVFKPLERRVAGAKLTTKGRVYKAPGGFRKLVTNGSFRHRFAVPYAGRYRLRARLKGDQAGPDPVRLGVIVDHERRALRALEGEEAQTLAWTLRLQRGRREVELAFLNDYYDPDHEDPGERDRNLALAWLELEGPLDPPALPPAHRELLGGAERLRWERFPEILRSLASRAYRRPARKEELQRLQALVDRTREQGRSAEEALQLVLTALLVSPHFLFRSELDAGPLGPKARRVPCDDWQLAARLSYFLWSSLPDAELRELAAAGKLSGPGRDQLLRKQVARLLDDPRAEALVELFAGQWLQLRRLDEVTPDPKLFPGFDEGLRDSMRAETELFVTACLRENRRVSELLAADFSFVDERLAKHYGIQGVQGHRFRRVRLPRDRAGLLTHASVLTLTSNATRTSPVKRGKWVLTALLDDPPPPPPPGADSLSSDLKRREGLSERERLELHRSKPTCASCHGRLDPLGFALERFDAVGVRRRDAALIDASGVLPDGTRLEDAAGLRSALLVRLPEFSAALARRLLVFALGRPLADSERAEVEALVGWLGPEVRLQELIAAVILTKPFLTRVEAP